MRRAVTTTGQSGENNDAHHIEVAPNSSMTPAGAVRFFAWIAFCTLALAAVLTYAAARLA